MTCNEELWPIFEEFEELAYTNMVRRDEAADRRLERLYAAAVNTMNRYHPEGWKML